MPGPFHLEQLSLAPDSEVRRLVAAYPDIEPRAYRDGELLVTEGEESQEVFIVLRGSYVVEKASLQGGGRPTLLASVMCDPEQIAIVGEMSLLGVHRRSANVRSVGLTQTLRLGLAHLEAVLNGYPAITRILCQQFSTRLRDTNNRLKELQERFVLNAQQRSAAPGDVLFSQGEPATTLFQVLMGTVRLEREGRVEVLGADRLPSGFLEPAPFLGKKPHSATAIVEEACFLVAIEDGHREALLRNYPDLALRLLEA